MARPRTTPRSPFGERLFAALSWSGYNSIVAFREATSATEHVIRAAEAGTSAPRIDVVAEWAAVLRISPAWLAFGGVYPEIGSGSMCSTVLGLLPAPLVSMLGDRYEELQRLGEAGGPTVAEWATVVRAWIVHSEEDVPHLLTEVTALQTVTHEFESSKTRRFYPGLAQFLADADDRGDVPDASERDILMETQFPYGLRPSPAVFHALLESIRAKPPRKK